MKALQSEYALISLFGVCGSYSQYTWTSIHRRGSYPQYIISGGSDGAAFFSGSSATAASVVSISPAIDDAFCNAVRAT